MNTQYCNVFLCLNWWTAGDSLSTPETSAANRLHSQRQRTVFALYWFYVFMYRALRQGGGYMGADEGSVCDQRY